MSGAAVIILAAGKGTRMDLEIPKVLIKVKDKPLIRYSIDLANMFDFDKRVVVVGYKADLVKKELENENVEFVLQEPQLGTGHAVMQAKPLLQDFQGDVLILYGDVPLISKKTIQALIDKHKQTNATVTVLTAVVKDTKKYGRIVRDDAGKFLKIVEHKDATEEQRKIKEINSGIYVVKSDFLWKALEQVKNENIQGEYYLTDIVEIAVEQGLNVQAVIAENPDEIEGVNTKEDVEHVERILEKGV